MVDVPCSGIHMLWFGLFAACALAAWYRLDTVRTLLCWAAALVTVVAANVVRATVLFFKEAHVVAWPEWTHAAVGVALFAAAAWAIGACAQHLQPRACARP
jgi:exosortase/archaeosortase family protein